MKYELGQKDVITFKRMMEIVKEKNGPRVDYFLEEIKELKEVYTYTDREIVNMADAMSGGQFPEETKQSKKKCTGKKITSWLKIRSKIKKYFYYFLFDHATAKNLYGEDWKEHLQQLAVTPNQERLDYVHDYLKNNDML